MARVQYPNTEPRHRPEYDGDGSVARHREKKRSGLTIAVALVAAGVIGGGALAAVLLAAGTLGHGQSVTTVVVQGRRGTKATGLDAGAVYKAAAAGVVDLTVRAARSRDEGGPFTPVPQETTATGTGFVVDSSGHILTADHVVENPISITVKFLGGRTASAEVVGTDPSADVALLKVDAPGIKLHPLALGTTRSLAVGDGLVVIGDPFKFSHSVSTGVASALDRSIEAPNGFTVSHAIQTDAALNPGNSGGPVLDATGRVVGVVDQIASGGTGTSSYTGVGFAVPIDIVKAELADLAKGRQPRHAYLGIDTTEAAGPPGASGALVQSVQPRSPAHAGGVRDGDVIVGIDGAPVVGSSDLVAAIAGRRPGDRLNLSVLRGSQRIEVTATLSAQPKRAR
jgi:S1-C subfamily serine protease